MSYHVTPLLTTIHWHNSPRINLKIYKHQAVLQTLLTLLALLKHLRAFALTILHLTHLQISAGFTPWRFCSNVVSFKETSFTILSKTAIISFSSHFSCSVFFITLSSLNIYLCDSLFILSLSLWYDVNSRRTEICHWFTLSETLLFQKQNSLLVVPGTCQILINLVYLTHLYSYLFIFVLENCSPESRMACLSFHSHLWNVVSTDRSCSNYLPPFTNLFIFLYSAYYTCTFIIYLFFYLSTVFTYWNINSFLFTTASLAF